MRSSFKKTAATFLIALSILPAAVLMAPRSAYAQTVVTDPLDIAQNTITAITSAKQLTAPIFWTLAKVVEQAVVKSIVNWINSGFKGSPAFATNINMSLQATADAAANGFLRQLSINGSIRSPFQNLVYQTVSRAYFQSSASNAYFAQNQYTLNRYVSNDAAFLAGATTQGGLGAWLAVVMNAQNNPFGAAMLAANALNAQVGGATNQLLTELNWGQGFLSYHGNCAASAAGDNVAVTQAAQLQANPVVGIQTNPSNLSTLSPTLGADVLGSVTLNKSGGANAPTSAVTPGTAVGNSAVTTVDLNNAGTIGNKDGNSAGATSLSGSAPCLGQSIQTPGTAIKASLDKALGSGIDTLVSARDFDEIVNALLSQLINQVIGPNGLLSTSQPSAATGGVPYFDQSTPAQTSANTNINTSLNSSFVQALQGQITALQQFQSNWSVINTAAQNAATALNAHSCPVNQQTLATQVQPVINQAAQALSAASYFISQISAIQNALPSSSDPNATVELAQISANYSALLATTTPYALPNSTDISFAQTQSIDSGTSTTPSLYTRMNQIANNAAQACGTGI